MNLSTIARASRPVALRLASTGRSAATLVSVFVTAIPAAAQVPRTTLVTSASDAVNAVSVDSLVSLALEANPRIAAARAQIEVNRARIAPAGALPDPMLGVGVMNVPVTDPGFDDFMTMKTLAVAQRVPFPGKLGLAQRAAEHELRAAESRLDVVRRDVVAEVRAAYYEVAFVDRALEVVARSQRLIVDGIQAAESRYAVGTGEQQDVLRARVEASRLADEAAALAESRQAAVARLNALLSQPAGTSLPAAAIPDRIARAAVAEDAAQIRFASSALGTRAADSPLPSLQELQSLAIQRSPELRAHEAEIAAQAARLELAGRAHLPDFDISLQYGQRAGRMDMASLMVSVPLPVHRRARQGEGVVEARAELAVMEAEHHAMVNRLNAEIAERYSMIERERSRLALFIASILPQGRAALQSATASFAVGRTDFAMLLDNERMLYDYETMVHRSLADFARALADLERIVGAEVLP